LLISYRLIVPSGVIPDNTIRPKLPLGGARKTVKPLGAKYFITPLPSAQVFVGNGI
jgi:hypothetical protein